MLGCVCGFRRGAVSSELGRLGATERRWSGRGVAVEGRFQHLVRENCVASGHRFCLASRFTQCCGLCILDIFMDEWDDALSPKDLDRGGIHDYVVVYEDRWTTTVRVIAWMGRNFARKWKWEDNIQKYEEGVRTRAGSYRSETKLLRLMFRRGKLAKMRLWNPPFYEVRLCYRFLWCKKLCV